MYTWKSEFFRRNLPGDIRFLKSSTPVTEIRFPVYMIVKEITFSLKNADCNLATSVHVM